MDIIMELKLFSVVENNFNVFSKNKNNNLSQQY